MNIFKKITISTLAMTFALSGVSLALAESSVSASASTSVGVSAGNTSEQNHRNILETNGSAQVKVSGSERAGKTDDNNRGTLRLNGKSSTTVSTDAIAKLKTRADQEITNRIDSLNKLQARLNGMVRLSASVKASLSVSIQASITEMNDLKAKIDADTDAAILKTDTASITASYRIYALVMPEIAIAAAADRINTIVDMMTTIGTKFQVRIQAISATGKDVSSVQASLNDYNAKVADAKVQAQTALTLSANLTPDNRDQARMEANRKALADARAKIKAGQDDLRMAREDARNILKGLKAFGDASVSASSSLKTR